MRRSSVNSNVFTNYMNLTPDNDRTPRERKKLSLSGVLPQDMVKQAKYMVEETRKAWTVMSRKGASDVVVSDENIEDMKKRGYTPVERFEYKPSRKELIDSFNAYLDACNAEGGD